MFTKHPLLLNLWARNSKFVEFADSSWTPFYGDVSESRLALITTAGVHLKTQQPFDMMDPTGDPTFREIQDSTSCQDLTITHNYYDHSAADKDINIVLPIDRINQLKQAGDIGEVNHRHFSFMGHITHQHIDTLVKEVSPQVAAALKADGVDIAILTSA